MTSTSEILSGARNHNQRRYIKGPCLRRAGRRLKDAFTHLLSDVSLCEVYGIASRPFISHQQGVVDDLQIRYEDPLYVFFHPELDPVMKDFYAPQFFPAGDVRGDDILILPLPAAEYWIPSAATGVTGVGGMRFAIRKLAKRAEANTNNKGFQRELRLFRGMMPQVYNTEE